MVLSEARGLRLSSDVRGGIGLHRRLSARRHKQALQCYWILFPRTRASQGPDSLSIRNDPGDERTDSSAKDAQAACCFKCLASKESPFFQTINVIAAIFRAKVRRAMVGFLPLTSKLS
jgi:hypothetical protein